MKHINTRGRIKRIHIDGLGPVAIRDMNMLDVTDMWTEELINEAEKRNDPRYVLHAFLCDGPCVRKIDHLGSSTFVQIMIERPSNCRYAVMQPEGKKIYWVVDLYSSVIFKPALPTTGMEIGTYTEYPTLDAAMAAGYLAYTPND